MSQSIEVKDICEEIWALEKEFNLLDITINDLKIWQLIRMHIFMKINMKKGIFTQAHTTKYGMKDKLMGLPSQVKSFIFYNPFFGKKQLDILILDHPKKQKVEGEYIDVYTKYFIDDLQKDNTNFEVIEMPHMHKHISKPEVFRKHSDAVNLLASLVRPFIEISVEKEVEQVLQSASEKLNAQLGLNIDLLSECLFFTKRYASQRIFIQKVLQRKLPKQMFVVVGYGYANWIQVAKELGIETIEFQHGLLSPYNLGYNFPNSKKGTVDTFADKLYIWKDFWRDMSHYPITDDSIIVYPFHFSILEQEKYGSITKNEKNITVISQGTITEKLAKMVLQNMDYLKGYNINYKLHPGEFDRWKNYSPLLKLSKYPNVTMIKDEIPLYQLFASSQYVIGVYSVALFEAMDFGCKVLVADIAGAELVKPMIDSGIFIKIVDRDIDKAIKKSDINENS